MARVSIDIPSSFLFTTEIPVRITDVNYGGHVGNDTVLSLIHEARVQFLQSFGYTELNVGNTSLIMGDMAISFKNELFYGDRVRISITVTDVSRVTFDLIYLLERNKDVIAIAKTGMVCFDYEKKKITAVPEEVKSRFTAKP